MLSAVSLSQLLAVTFTSKNRRTLQFSFLFTAIRLLLFFFSLTYSF